MIPYSKKFWGVDPKDLTTDWVNVRHPRPSLDEVITGAIQDQSKRFGINGNYRYPDTFGFGNIAESLEKASKGKIHYNMNVTSIDVDKMLIEFNNSTKISYKDILSSIPLPHLISLIPNAPKNVIDASKKLRTNSIFVVNLAVDRPNITKKNWIYFLEKEYSFIRVSFPFNQSDNMAPKGTSTISAEIAYGNDNPLEKNNEKIINRVIDDLVKTKIIKKSDKIIYSKAIDVELGYVIFDKERRNSIKIIHNYLKSKRILPFGRYGLWAYLWSDEAILSGKGLLINIKK